MKWLTNWFIDNPVAANLLMVMILAGGILSIATIRVESFPQIPPSRININVVYPGGTAAQVDESITQRVEDAISSIPGIEKITSVSQPGLSRVTVKKTTDTDLSRLLDDIRNKVNVIQGFPLAAEQPQVVRDEFTNLAAYVVVYGDVDNKTLKQSVIRTVQALKAHPDISQVTNLADSRQLLTIEPDPEKLRRYNLDISGLNQRIKQWSLEYRSGELKTAQGTLVLRSDMTADTLLKLRNLPVINTQEGTIYLKDIADIKRDFNQGDSVVRYQGKSAAAILVSTSRKDNLLHVSEAIQQVLKDVKPALPANVELDAMADMAPYIKDQLNRLGNNAWQGLLIVLLLLGLFLNIKLAFWVAVGIPVSLAGALWLMGPLNYTINDITLFGMILVLGVLVDDAVVVGESIHTARGEIANPRDAARTGVEAVATATVFGVLTTIAAFSPMLWIKNELAQVLAGFSAIVILALIFSLIESKFILPAHLAHSKAGKDNRFSRIINRVRVACLAALDHFGERYYLPALRFSLHNKAAVLLLFVSFMVLAYGLWGHGTIKAAFFPEIPGRFAQVKVTMNLDAPVPLAVKGSVQLEQALKVTDESLQQDYDLSASAIERAFVFTDAAKSVEVVAELTTEALSAIPANELLKRWQMNTSIIEGAYSSQFTAADEPAGGTALSITSRDRELSRRVAQQLKPLLQQLPGVNDVYDDSQGGQRQLRLSINQQGRQLGLTQADLALIVGGAFGNLEVQRLLYQGEETRIQLRFPDNLRRTQEQLHATPVRVDDNKYVSLAEIADIEFTREAQVLYRRDREGVVSVYWRQNRNIAAPEEVLDRLKKESIPQLEKQYPGVKIKAAGEFEEISDVKGGFKKAMLLTLLLIYILLAVPLKSYYQPFIIMSIIPFGYAGAIYGHGLMGLPVSILSLFGMMAMTGVVINDSLVLMTRFNRNYHEQGMSVKDALIDAGRSRLRAIFLTTVTTVCGLLPLLMETSEQAQYLKPAAVSLVFGELFATPITLILIPVLLAMGKYKRDPHNRMNNAQQPAEH